MKIHFKDSIYTKILFNILIIPLVLFLILLMSNIFLTKDQLNKEVKHSISERKAAVAEILNIYTKNFFEKCLRYSRDVQLVVPLNFHVNYQAHEYLSKLEVEEQLDDVIVIDKNNRPIVSSKSDTDFKMERQYLMVPDLLNREVFFRKLGRKIIITGVTKIEFKGSLLGYLIVSRDVHLSDLFGKVLMVDEEFVYSVSPSASGMMDLYGKDFGYRDLGKGLIEAGDYYLSSIPLKDFTGYEIARLVFGRSFTEKFEAEGQSVIFIVGIFLILLLVIIFLAVILGKNISNPIIELSDISKAISKGAIGDFSKGIDRNDEIGILYKNFKLMVDKMLKSQAELEKAKGDLKKRVKERTSELLRTMTELRMSNRKLEKEILVRQKTSEELKVAKDTAEKANRAKSEFLANVSHEIRTPMNSILGFTDILGEEIENPRHKKYLNAIGSSGKTLLGLINDILDLSKIEAGKMELNYTPVNPRAILKEMEYMFSQKIEEKNLAFKLTIDPSIPQFLVMDEVRLRQVIFNLVGNAVKFTDEGHVLLSMDIRKIYSKDKKVDITIAVEDTGLGIDEEQQSLIFEAFYQQAEHSDKKYGGTGLGLPITKRLVKMMNGEISVESQPGNGSKFRVDIFGIKIVDELIEKKKETPEEIIKKAFNQELILVVDDIKINRELVKVFLKKSNVKIIEAENGAEAIDLAKDENPSVILMDLKMPVMNGYEAIKILKSDPALKDIPVIALTANAMKSDEDYLFELGCNGYLTKPLRKAVLLNELDKFLKLDS